MSNIITPVFNGQRGVTNAVYQYDYGMILDLSGIADLPDTYEVQFCNRCGQRTLPQVASGSSVAVPDAYLTTGLGVEAYVFVHTGADDGETVYQISIPVIRRPVPAEGTPTPVQQDAITEAIAALNAGVAAAEQSAEEAAQSAQDAAAAAEDFHGIPDGGSIGQILRKTGSEDGAAEWTAAEYDIGLIRPSNVEQTFYTDKSPAEIKAAHDAGFTLVAHNGNTKYRLAHYSETGIGGTVTVHVGFAAEEMTTFVNSKVCTAFFWMGQADTTASTVQAPFYTWRVGIPPRGTTGQILAKVSDTDFSADWRTLLQLGALSFNSQTLTDEQQAQARDNIGAASLSDLGTVFDIKGDVATVAALPATGNRVGDVWFVQEVSAAYVWLETTEHPSGYWEEFGEPIDLSGYIEAPANPTQGQVLVWNGSAWVAAALPAAPVSSVNGQTGAVQIPIPDSASDVGAVASDQGIANAGKFLVVGSDGIVAPVTQDEEVTISTAGAVTQALDAGKVYHFTGAITALTITLNAAAAGLSHYHFDFLSGATAPTLTMPNTVTMPDSFTVEANKRYEVDILNSYGAVMAWAIS